MSIPLIIDTDTAQDDCIAILVGLLDDLADLRAITVVAGNVGFARQVRNAHMTLTLLPCCSLARCLQSRSLQEHPIAAG